MGGHTRLSKAQSGEGQAGLTLLSGKGPQFSPWLGEGSPFSSFSVPQAGNWGTSTGHALSTLASTQDPSLLPSVPATPSPFWKCFLYFVLSFAPAVCWGRSNLGAHSLYGSPGKRRSSELVGVVFPDLSAASQTQAQCSSLCGGSQLDLCHPLHAQTWPGSISWSSSLFISALVPLTAPHTTSRYTW